MAVSRGAKREPDGRGYKCSGSVADCQGDSSERGSQVASSASGARYVTDTVLQTVVSCRDGLAQAQQLLDRIYTYVQVDARPVNP